ncbi:MAG: hypothetical protein ACE10C_06010, partial [Candidatus Binatia bacterium]
GRQQEDRTAYQGRTHNPPPNDEGKNATSLSADPPYIRDQLGHFSIQMTVDIYGHLVPGGNRQAVDKLDDNLSGEPPAESGSKTVADDPQGKPKYA